MFGKEVKYHVAALRIVARIHGHLSEKVFNRRIHYGKSTQTVPQVIESGIFFAVSEIFEEKKGRHIGTYHAGDTVS